jgi:hypothetical protein
MVEVVPVIGVTSGSQSVVSCPGTGWQTGGVVGFGVVVGRGDGTGVGRGVELAVGPPGVAVLEGLLVGEVVGLGVGPLGEGLNDGGVDALG